MAAVPQREQVTVRISQRIPIVDTEAGAMTGRSGGTSLRQRRAA